MNRLEVDGKDLTVQFKSDLDNLDLCDAYIQLAEDGPKIVCDWQGKYHKLDHVFTTSSGFVISMLKIGHLKEDTQLS